MKFFAISLLDKLSLLVFRKKLLPIA